MAINGSLDEASLADVLQLLSLSRKTGRLSVSDQANLGHIFLENGRIIHAFLANRRQRLGDILFKSGHITQDQLNEAIQNQEESPDKKVGEILIENCAITESALQHYMQVQIEEAIYFLFTWRRGDFAFERDVKPDPHDFLVSINPESLLLEGARRVDEWGVIEKKIPSFDMVFRVDKERLDASDVDLSEEQIRVASLLDGARSVAEIATESALIQFEVGKALYGLITAGFAEPVAPKKPTGSPSRDSGGEGGHLDHERMLAYLLHQAEFADENTRRRSALHIADCPTCSKRLQEIHIRRSQGLPAYSEADQEETSSPPERRSGVDRRLADGELPADVPEDRRVHGAGDRRSSARVAAVEGRPSVDRRVGGDRREDERREGDRRRKTVVDRSDRYAVERRRGLERRLRDRRVVPRRAEDVRLKTSGGKRVTTALDVGGSDAVDSGDSPPAIRSSGSRRTPRSSKGRSRKTSARARGRNKEKTSDVADDRDLEKVDVGQDLNSETENDKKAPSGDAPEGQARRATRPSVRMMRESPLRGLPLLADGTQWMFVERADSEEEAGGPLRKSGPTTIDEYSPPPEARSTDVDIAVPTSEAETEEITKPEAQTESPPQEIPTESPPEATLTEPNSEETTNESSSKETPAEAITIKTPAESSPPKTVVETAPPSVEEPPTEPAPKRRLSFRWKKESKSQPAVDEETKKELEKARAEAEKAKQEAEAAKAEAERARREAAKTKEEAGNARSEAEKAKRNAERAAKKAEKAASRAESEKSEAAKKKSEAIKTESEAKKVKEEIEQARAEAEAARIEAETARANAEKARLEAEEATSRADRTTEEAENARADAQNARLEAERSRAEAERAKNEAEEARSEFEAAAAKRKEKRAGRGTPVTLRELVADDLRGSKTISLRARQTPIQAATTPPKEKSEPRTIPVRWVAVAAIAIGATAIGWLARPFLEGGRETQVASADRGTDVTAESDQPFAEGVPLAISDSVVEDPQPEAPTVETTPVPVAAETAPPVPEPRQEVSAPVQTAEQNPLPAQPEVTEAAPDDPVAEEPIVEELVPEPEPAPGAPSLRGVVRARTGGTALVGASVSLVGGDITAQTDANGAFVFDSVPLGTLSIVVDRDGYMPATESIETAAGESSELVIELTSPPSANQPDEELNAEQWAVTDLDEAVAVLGRPVAVIGGLWIESVAVPATGTRPRVRVAQLVESGERITLVVSRSGPANRAASNRVTALRIIPPSEAYPITTGTASIGGLMVTAKATLSADTLRSLLRRLETIGG